VALGTAVVAALLGGQVDQALAAYQQCGDKYVELELTRCPDGSVPRYNGGTAPSVAGRPTGGPATPAADSLYGVWHTNRPGQSYQSAIDVPGAYLLAARVGLASGDLTISPNGTYVWNGLSATSGRWVKGDPGQIVLIDETDNQRWKVARVGDRLTVTGKGSSFTGRR
jgi:hypothetical protein